MRFKFTTACFKFTLVLYFFFRARQLLSRRKQMNKMHCRKKWVPHECFNKKAISLKYCTWVHIHAERTQPQCLKWNNFRIQRQFQKAYAAMHLWIVYLYCRESKSCLLALEFFTAEKGKIEIIFSIIFVILWYVDQQNFTSIFFTFMASTAYFN